MLAPIRAANTVERLADSGALYFGSGIAPSFRYREWMSYSSIGLLECVFMIRNEQCRPGRPRFASTVACRIRAGHPRRRRRGEPVPPPRFIDGSPTPRGRACNPTEASTETHEIGREACRERGCQNR